MSARERPGGTQPFIPYIEAPLLYWRFLTYMVSRPLESHYCAARGWHTQPYFEDQGAPSSERGPWATVLFRSQDLMDKEEGSYTEYVVAPTCWRLAPLSRGEDTSHTTSFNALHAGFEPGGRSALCQWHSGEEYTNALMIKH